MDHPSIWVKEKEAGQILGVNEKTLDSWREDGYLKAGTHWRSSFDTVQIPWNPKVIYNIRFCSELIESWKEHDTSVQNLVG